MSGKYILVKQKAVPCHDLVEWGMWMQERVKHVGDITTKRGIRISTVFLGLDHQYGEGEPLLFETMIFGNNVGDMMCRYSTFNQAREGHRRAIKLVRRMTKCPIKKKFRKNLSLNRVSNLTTAIHAIRAINDLLCSSQEPKPTIPTCVAPVTSELLKPSNPIDGKSANV